MQTLENKNGEEMPKIKLEESQPSMGQPTEHSMDLNFVKAKRKKQV
jgi:hypothetical protein